MAIDEAQGACLFGLDSLYDLLPVFLSTRLLNINTQIPHDCSGGLLYGLDVVEAQSDLPGGMIP
jgi:hypothetical protein